MKQAVILSHFQAKILLDAGGLQQVEVSPNLGLTKTVADISKDGVCFWDLLTISWDTIKTIAKKPNTVFKITGSSIEKIQTISDLTGRVFSLYPTEKAPTMLVSGLLMHRVKGTDPLEDTKWKVKAISPAKGRVLDTATGLGYTAIMAARTADRVDTIELDPAAVEMTRQNPWSKELFENPAIVRHQGDAAQVVTTFEDNAFSAIIHDPPVIGLGGDLYGLAFYQQLFRVLAPRGRLFHYIGNPDSPSGKRTTQGVMRRLAEAGFERVATYPKAFGVTAYRAAPGRR
ncbi:MAG: methyltransferase [Desulfatibacillaceae bacterium]|nr:methyltransferase [Desulfatibacillaceae bacterium]